MISKYNLFVDDIRYPNDVTWVNLPKDQHYTVVRNYQEFVDIITLRGVPQFVSLDHDLGISSYSEYFNSVKNGYINYENICEMTGLDCAKYLINYCIEKDFQFPKYVVHSMNPIGKQNIISLIESFKKINISL
jgi:hypothetical protein